MCPTAVGAPEGGLPLTGYFTVPIALTGVASICLGAVLVWCSKRRRRWSGRPRLTPARPSQLLPEPPEIPRLTLIRPEPEWEVLADLPEEDDLFGVLADPPAALAGVGLRPFPVALTA